MFTAFTPTYGHNLRSEIFSGAWMMDPQHAKGFFLDYLSAGPSEQDQAKKPTLDLHSIIHFVSPDGGVQKFGDENLAKDSVAVINLIGPMLKYSYIGWFSSLLGALDIAQLMRMCAGDGRISGIVLRIDSGGGQASSVAPIQAAIREIDIPVIAYCDTAASAAYWVAAECVYIALDNDINSAVGSIGVYTQWMDVRGYWEEMGVKFHEVYAPESSNKNREMREANEGKYKSLEENILSPMAQRFQAAVKENRTRLKSDEPLKGGMYFAKDAIANGLADGVQSLADCIDMARNFNGIN